jgi:hypothetical protein
MLRIVAFLPEGTSLVFGGVVFWRFLVIVPSVAMIFWIASYFSGFTAFVVFLFLWNCLSKLCRELFLHPIFATYSDFQTLDLSSKLTVGQSPVSR